MPLILQIRHFINIQYTKFNPTPLTSLEFVVVVIVVFVFVACCFCCHCCLLCCGRDTPLGWFHKVWESLDKRALLFNQILPSRWQACPVLSQ